MSQEQTLKPVEEAGLLDLGQCQSRRWTSDGKICGKPATLVHRYRKSMARYCTEHIPDNLNKFTIELDERLAASGL